MPSRGDERALARFATGGGGQRLVQHVFASPQALATVNEEFALGTDGHEVDGRSQDDTLGGEEFGVHHLIFVLHHTAPGFPAAIAGNTGTHLQAGSNDPLHLRASLSRTLQRPFQQKIGVASAAWAADAAVSGAGDNTLSARLGDGEDLIEGDIVQALLGAIGPGDFDGDSACVCPKAELDRQTVLGSTAGPTAYLPYLGKATGDDPHTGPDASAVADGPQSECVVGE